MRPARTSVAAVLLLTLATLGCSPQPEVAPPASPTVTLDRIPEGVLRAARQQLPGVEFQEARVIASGGGLAYELLGHSDEGRPRSVRVSASGQILAVE
ncbi:MAG TPA: hypothetical protein VF590_10075 [Isosphaeraceae bacterium]